MWTCSIVRSAHSLLVCLPRRRVLACDAYHTHGVWWAEGWLSTTVLAWASGKGDEAAAAVCNLRGFFYTHHLPTREECVCGGGGLYL